MNPDPHSRRFDPRWLLPAIEKDGVSLFEEPDAALPFEAEELKDDPIGRDVDEALEQMGLGGFKVCPLCGAIVARDGTVLD
jgi:hypothetical protein